ncbi:GNAT family N-acetyltransferase [Chloroflexota bacterium]
MMKDNLGHTHIVVLDQTNIADINKMDNSFEVNSRIIPSIKDGQFSYTLEDVPNVYTKSYPDDEVDYNTYIGNPEKVALLAYINAKAVGQITLVKWWNKFACVEDIRVEGNYRKMGVGTKLMDAAVSWVQGTKMPGIMLETQDTNVPACLFYQKYGFVLGGADKMLYRGTGNSSETALFWYFVL